MIFNDFWKSPNFRGRYRKNQKRSQKMKTTLRGGIRRSTRWYKNHFHIFYGLGATDPELKLQTPLSSRDIAIPFSHLFKLTQFWYFFNAIQSRFWGSQTLTKSQHPQKVPEFGRVFAFESSEKIFCWSPQHTCGTCILLQDHSYPQKQTARSYNTSFDFYWRKREL